MQSILCAITFFKYLHVALKVEKQALKSPRGRLFTDTSRHLAQNKMKQNEKLGPSFSFYLRCITHTQLSIPFKMTSPRSVIANSTNWKDKEYCIILSCGWNGREGKKNSKTTMMTETKDAFSILTFCSFFSDILSPCLANCQKCGTHQMWNKEKRETEQGETHKQCEKRTKLNNSKKLFYTYTRT